MPIYDRNFQHGDKLIATYKEHTYHCTVIQEHGKLLFRYHGEYTDGRCVCDCSSVSAAGIAVFGEGRTCNGFLFWSREGDGRTERPMLPPKKGRSVTTPKPPRVPHEDGDEDAPIFSKEPSLPIVEQLDETYECGECFHGFATRNEVKRHLAEAHGITDSR